MMPIRIPLDFRDRHICVLGLGFVGLTLSAVMAEAGFRISGVEIREEVREMIEMHRAHFFEPGLNESLYRAAASGRLNVFQQIPTDCDATVFIITVGTPLGSDGRANLDSVQRIAAQIAERLKDGDLVVLRSTVKIGTTDQIIRPLLEQTGRRFEIAYCPERTVEGEALKELGYVPQIIGARELGTVNRAAQLFSFITPTVIRVSSAETAELIKLIDNAKRDVMFAFSNEVARMCDALGISAAEVIRSGRFGYARTDLPMPGPVGGPCLSKDSHILAESIEPFGLTPEIAVAARLVNERQPREIAEFIRTHVARFSDFPTAPKVALLGIAFKGQPVTDDVRGTMALPILLALREVLPKAQFVAYDPVVDAETVRKLGLAPTASLEEASHNASLAVVLNNHPMFGSMPIEHLAARMRQPSLIYDCWNHFIDQPFSLPAGVEYIALGSHVRRPL
jgi:UDP-N-acetyl-D-mannosaminuronic acid dehydrogenase